MPDEPPELPKLYTEKEAAEFLRCAQGTLGRKRRAREISHTRVGGKVRYTKQQILDYIEAETRPAIKRETSGSASGTTARRGIAHGTTPPPEGLDAAASLRRILKQRRGGSKTGTSPTTGPCEPNARTRCWPPS